MSNIFQKLGIGIADFGKWFATAVKETANLAANPGNPHGRTAAAKALCIRSFDGGRRCRGPDRFFLCRSYRRRPELPG